MSKKIRDPAILNSATGTAEGITEVRRQEALLKTGALQNAILNSANFSSIATDAKDAIIGYLTKPIKVNEFMDALDMALELAETGLDGAVMPGSL